MIKTFMHKVSAKILRKVPSVISYSNDFIWTPSINQSPPPVCELFPRLELEL